MRDSFSSFYKLETEQIKKIWAEAIFVFDANVLLNIYRYPESVSKEILSTLSIFKDRIWLPHSVALEFQRNRLNVIGEQKHRIVDVEKVISAAIEKFTSELRKLELDKRHSFVEPDVLLSFFNAAGSQAREKVDEFSSKQMGVNDSDVIREKIDTLFKSRVGPRMVNQETLDDLYKKFSARYSINQPPGFKDKEKSGGDDSRYFHEGIVYQSQYGDALCWEQMLIHFSEQESPQLIFVTDDSKEDWWWQVQSSGKKTIGPRRELIEEYSLRTSSKNFLMYKSSEFLKYANENSNANISDESITYVDDHADEVSNASSKRDAQEVVGSYFKASVPWQGGAEIAVSRSVVNSYPGLVSDFTHNYPDIIMLGINRSMSFAVQVLAIPDMSYADYVAGPEMRRLDDYVKEREFDRGVLYLVTPNGDEKLYHTMLQFVLGRYRGSKIQVVVASLGADGELDRPVLHP